MFRATFAAVSISLLMLMGSLLVVPASQGAQGQITFQEVSPLTSVQPMVPQDMANFTMYVPQTSYANAVAQSALSYLGVTPHRFGSLWTFSVPGKVAQRVNTTLQSLTSSSGVTFFQSSNGTLVNPSISFSYTGQNLNIPFAFTPGILSRAYNFTWPLSHGINGTGITIGIVDAYGNPNLQYDIKSFDAVNGLPALNLTILYPNGKPGSYNATWAMETSTDVEWAHAMAPGAKIVLLVGTSSYTSDLQNVVSYAVSNDVANILSLSWGNPENGLSLNAELTYSQVYSQAAAKGITVLAASGDNGAYSGGPQLTVDFPASDPYVTGVGGTSLYAFNNKFQQSGWGGILNGESYGSGGGYSTVFNTPYWQVAHGYNGSRRGVPDVAIDANKYTGVYVISSGGQYIVGGTSVSTPIWASVMALVEQYTGVHLHSANPLLYQIARTNLYQSSFTQILTGTNGYYQNTPYWNPVTGLGTPRVAALLNDSKAILEGYGGFVVFNGSRSYNATSISTYLNLSPVQGNLQNNGTTYYYNGFYLNPENFVKFGVLLNSTGEYLMLVVSQAGNSFYRYYSMPGGFGGKLDMFNIRISYGSSSISFSTSGFFVRSIPLALNFSGEMSPMAGVSQIDSQTNLTVINSGVFSHISLSNGTGYFTPQYMYFLHDDFFNSTTYSTIDAVSSGEQIQFLTSNNPENPILGAKSAPAPEIFYKMDYGYPTKLAFQLKGATADVNWSVNSTPMAGKSTFVAQNGGPYEVNATFTNSFGFQETVTRNITIPPMHLSNVSVNYTIQGSVFPDTMITDMYFYQYYYTGPGMQVPALNSTTALGASAPGFYGEDTTSLGTQNISFRLPPRDVNVTVFVFNVNATVTFNNVQAGETGGYYYRSMQPGQDLYVNISKAGYQNQTEEMLLQPGENISFQTGLIPNSSGYLPLSGSVTDVLYSFPVDNALVKINSTLGSYTNSSGTFFLYPVAGRYNVSSSAYLYDNFSTPLNISAPTILNIKMTPAKIAVNSGETVSITHYFPLLFYLGFLSWSPYKGKNFSIYQIYISRNQNFLSPSIKTVSSQNSSYTFLTGLTPGSTYYISVVLRLSNSQVYQSQVVKITYSDPVYLGINLVLAGAIGFYVYVGYRVFRKRRNRNEVQ